jgi:hypothetical protein
MATEADIAWWTSQSGRDWSGLCQAYISNLCDAFGTLLYYPPSAIDAYYASNIQSYDAYSAPSGAVVWLDIGVYGHVQFRVDGPDVGHGSSHCLEFWGTNAGAAQVAWYVAQTGATPLGWSWDSAGSTLPYSPAGAPVPPPPPPEDIVTVIYRNESGGEVRAIAVEVGYDYHIPDEPYLDLVIGWNIFGTKEITDVPDNIYQYVRSLAADARNGTTSVD